MEAIGACLVGVSLAVFIALAVSWPLRSHQNWMYFEQDDFFYYLQIARNFAAGHGSTFNQIVPTNGYHPLWMLTLAAVYRMGVGSHGIFIFLGGCIAVATLCAYAFTMVLLRRNGNGWLLSSTAAAFVAVYCSHLFYQGMEVILTIPLMIGLMAAVQATAWWSDSRRGLLRCIGVGLIAACMVLSRLDTALFAALIGISIALQPHLRRLVRRPQMIGVAIGLAPVLAYALINRFVFGLWLPVSGMAKDLKVDHGFTTSAIATLESFSRMQRANLVAILFMIGCLPWIWKWVRPADRAYAAAALLFPVAYMAVLSWVSDWPLWGWYFYSLRTALCVSVVVLLSMPRIAQLVSWKPVLTLFVLATLLRIVALKWDYGFTDIADAAEDIRVFASTHPGIYAMGDRAGMPGYLLDSPLIQTEGLVMDREYLNTLKQRPPLLQVLRKYHVRYYIGTAMNPYTGCFTGDEPAKAGAHAPHMYATFCQQPVARWTHQKIQTLVYDLDQDPRLR